MTASLGIASLLPAGDSPDTLLKRADKRALRSQAQPAATASSPPRPEIAPGRCQCPVYQIVATSTQVSRLIQLIHRFSALHLGEK